MSDVLRVPALVDASGEVAKFPSDTLVSTHRGKQLDPIIEGLFHPGGYTVSGEGYISLSKVDVLTVKYQNANYYCSSCLNTPTGTNGWLSVNYANTSNFILTYTEYTGNVYRRVKKSGTLGDWELINNVTAWPVGSIYTSVNNINPSSLFGGTWIAYAQGRTLVGVDTTQTEFNAVKKVGGHKNMQSHGHSIDATSSANGSHSHVTKYHYFANGTGTTYGHTVGGSWSFDSPMNGVSEAGNHDHTISGSTTDYGLGDAQNLQPFITVYFWLRTA